MIPTKNEWLEVLQERHGKELQKKFSSAVVAVCGLGGLGSNIAIALARAGVGKLILIDFDRVDLSNLHRQQYQVKQIGLYKTEAMREQLKEIAPYLDIQIHTIQLDETNAGALLSGADVVCEAFDQAEVKASLVNFVRKTMPDRYIVSASGMAGMGNCNTIKTRKISKMFYLCGDETSDISDEMGLVSSRVMLCAAHQAHTVLRIIAEKFEV